MSVSLIASTAEMQTSFMQTCWHLLGMHTSRSMTCCFQDLVCTGRMSTFSAQCSKLQQLTPFSNGKHAVQTTEQGTLDRVCCQIWSAYLQGSARRLKLRHKKPLKHCEYAVQIPMPLAKNDMSLKLVNMLLQAKEQGQYCHFVPSAVTRCTNTC